MNRRKSTTYGFARTASLVQGRVRAASESRGFAQSRILTHWEEVAGADLSAISRPVDISYGRGGMGATLTLLTTGANAPVLEMQKDALRTRINSVYGYNAIARLRITQTAASGFSEGQVSFAHKRSGPAVKAPSAATVQKAQTTARNVQDSDLRAALERLGANVMTKQETQG